MDFAWVVDALRRGLKVARKDWLLAIPPMYLYMVTEKKPDGKHIIKMHPGTGPDFDWTPTAEQMLIVDDWEEYVEPKKKPAAGYISLSSEKETKLPNNPSYDDEQATTRLGDTMTVEEYRRVHSGEKHTFQDLCDDYLEQQKGKVQINPLPFTTTLEMHDGEVCESWPAVTKVWTTYWDLDIQITGALIDKADYPYTLCERDVIEQKSDKLVVLAEPGFSQRTVTLHLNENCWTDAKDASASLIHRLTNRFGWNTEFFISLLNGIEHTDGDWCKPCCEGDNRSLGDLFTEDMEFLAQEQARVAHSFYYIINQYLRLVQTTAPERQRRDILARYEESLRRHRTVFEGLSKKDTNQEKEG